MDAEFRFLLRKCVKIVKIFAPLVKVGSEPNPRIWVTKPEVGPENIFSAKNRTPPFDVKTHTQENCKNLELNREKPGN